MTAAVRPTVPGNRWDLVADRVDDARPPSVAVIVPYFEQPESLARMYAALADLDPAVTHVVIADDGSAHHPARLPPPGFPLTTSVVRQPDLGCRPGAARNLGAATAAEADVLVFLDADTVPAPGTVGHLAAWPALLPDALVVGLRHHADLTGWTPDATMAWLRGDGSAPPVRNDPVWLADGYRSSRDLLDVDERSYRFVISAVMACHRSLWDDIGGFDPTRAEYGGDDWEFASRAFNNGAVLVHEPRAVAWHDEPDWSERDGGSKTAEALWLAEVIAEPSTRGPAVRHHDPALLATLPTAGAEPGDIVATITDVAGAVPDCRLQLDGPVPSAVARYVCADARITTAPPDTRQRQRARWALHLGGPVRWDAGGLISALAAVGPAGCGRLEICAGGRPVAEIVSTRAAARVRRAGGGDELLAELFGVRQVAADEVGLAPIVDDVDVAALFRGSSSRRCHGSGRDAGPAS